MALLSACVVGTAPLRLPSSVSSGKPANNLLGATGGRNAAGDRKPTGQLRSHVRVVMERAFPCSLCPGSRLADIVQQHPQTQAETPTFAAAQCLKGVMPDVSLRMLLLRLLDLIHFPELRP